MQAQRKPWAAALAVAGGVLVLAHGSVAAANLSGRWVATFSAARGTFTLRWDITDRGGRLSGTGANRKYTITGTGTAGGPFSLHLVFSDRTRDFTGTVDAAGRTMTGSWVGSRGGSGTATATRTGNPPTIGSNAPLPPPKPGVAVNIQDGPGTTYVRLPGTTDFATLRGGAQIRVGSELDTTTSTVILTSAEGKSNFTKGSFLVKEPRVSGARLTDLVLTGGNFSKCPKSSKRRLQALDQPIRQVWGSGKGKFRTTGKYAAATVRGTQWRVIDRCDGTLTKVLSGSVTVKDFKRKKTVVVTAGHTYLAQR
jgi:hypothetical protein